MSSVELVDFALEILLLWWMVNAFLFGDQPYWLFQVGDRVQVHLWQGIPEREWWYPGTITSIQLGSDPRDLRGLEVTLDEGWVVVAQPESVEVLSRRATGVAA